MPLYLTLELNGKRLSIGRHGALLSEEVFHIEVRGRLDLLTHEPTMTVHRHKVGLPTSSLVNHQIRSQYPLVQYMLQFADHNQGVWLLNVIARGQI